MVLSLFFFDASIIGINNQHRSVGFNFFYPQ